jgi:hypothetical protein
MNRNGRIDVVLNKVWFENPGDLTEKPDKLWPAHVFGGGGHDIIAADISGDGQLDVITYDGSVVSWFDTSASLNQTDIGRGEHNMGAYPKGRGRFGRG